MENLILRPWPRRMFFTSVCSRSAYCFCGSLGFDLARRDIYGATEELGGPLRSDFPWPIGLVLIRRPPAAGRIQTAQVRATLPERGTAYA